MLFLLYLILAVTLLLAGWSVSVGSALTLIWTVWYGVAWAWSGLIEAASSYLDLAWQLPFLSYPPSLISWVVQIASWIVPTLLVWSVLSLLQPAGWCLRRFSKPYAVERLPHRHPLRQAATDMARHLGVSPPAVYLIHQPQPNAFAVSSWLGSAIGISAPLAAHLPEDSLQWVIGHELGHLKYRDALAKTFWIVGLRLNASGFHLKTWIDRIVLSIVGRVFFGPFRIIAYGLLLPFRWASWLMIGVFRGLQHTFWYATRFLDRTIEFRCDRVACEVASSLAGITTLQSIDGNWEQPSRWLRDTHPAAYDRIGRLSQYAKQHS